MSPPKLRVPICLIRTMFRPRGFSPPRRFAPPFAPSPGLPRDLPKEIPLRVAGLLHPAANRGVRRVSGRVPLLPGVPAILAPLSYPSKDSPHPQPYRVTTAFCLPAVPSPRCSNLPGFALPLAPFNPHRTASVDFKALLCGWVRTIVRRFQPPMAYPPVGFCSPPRSFDHERRLRVARDEWPSRFRGSVAIPTLHTPVGSVAAHLDPP